MPTIASHLYVLAVPDLARSGAFYRDVLGFDVREMGDPGWRMFVKDGCRIMAGACPDALPARDLGDHSYFAYLVVDDVDGYCAQAVAAGAEVTKVLRTEPWGMREFGIRTVDGHRLMVGSPVGPARDGRSRAGRVRVRCRHDVEAASVHANGDVVCRIIASVHGASQRVPPGGW